MCETNGEIRSHSRGRLFSRAPGTVSHTPDEPTFPLPEARGGSGGRRVAHPFRAAGVPRCSYWFCLGFRLLESAPTKVHAEKSRSQLVRERKQGCVEVGVGKLRVEFEVGVEERL